MKESIADIQLWPQVSGRVRKPVEENPKIVYISVEPRKDSSAIWAFLTGVLGSGAFWLVFWGLFLGPAV